MSQTQQVAYLTTRIVDAVDGMPEPIELKVAALKSAATLLENCIAADMTKAMIAQALKKV